MTIHEQMFGAGSQDVLDVYHGQTITVTDSVGTITPLAIVSTERIERRKGDRGVVVVFTRTASIESSEVSSLNASKPTIGMTVTIGGVAYDVENISSTGTAVILALVRYEIRERSRSDYRGR